MKWKLGLVFSRHRQTVLVQQVISIGAENRQHGRRRWHEPTSWGNCRRWLRGCAPCRHDNLDSSIQNWHFTDGHPLNLILGSQPKDCVCFGWVEKEPTRTHAALEVVKAARKLVDCRWRIIQWRRDTDLAIYKCSARPFKFLRVLYKHSVGHSR